jgi:alanyl-tRNA synthetase
MIEVTNTQRLPNDLFVHQGTVKEGEAAVGATAHLEVDGDRRRAIARHHTTTHILQAVLQRELGGHVKQSGSLVAPERFRFDFTHFAAITPEELAKIELDLNLRRGGEPAGGDQHHAHGPGPGQRRHGHL